MASSQFPALSKGARLAETRSHLVCAVQLWVSLGLRVPQPNGLVQQLGHSLVVGVVLALGFALDEPIVLQLGQGLQLGNSWMHSEEVQF